ncbi:hypothetical protein [Natronobacterium texcoconense]|uniref:Uncharacterized protein n=1 Tax=Natronobacterium texcoconense TaxID=1095778 RepID=A0A1H1B974_NATTX|nr:hypothetical protein [Natronobacterium texcoconense]SDQ48433.1 hypothetical protein SAMN04489842_0968 [Natronobacterium texcoconense]
MHDDRNLGKSSSMNGSIDSGRRTFLRTAGIAAAVPLLGSASVSGTDDDYDPLDDDFAPKDYETFSVEDDFDPLEFGINERHWEGEISGTNPGDGSVTIRRTLFLNEVYEGRSRNIFEFGLSSFGLALRDDFNESDLPNGIHPMNIFGRDHELGVTSTDIDVSNVTTNAPRIGAEMGEDVLEDNIPNVDDDEWTTDLEDLEEADIDVGNNDLPLVLGGASIVFGLAAAAPPVGAGAAAILTGTSAALGVGGMAASLGDEYDTENQTSDEWTYELKETSGTLVTECGAFMHNVLVRVPVDHGENASVTFYSHIQNSGGRPVPYDQPHSWIGDAGDDDEWTILIPGYGNASEARSDPPSIPDIPSDPPSCGPNEPCPTSEDDGADKS